MLRRSRSNGDTLPTHGASGELLSLSSSRRGYGRFNDGGSSNGGGIYGNLPKYGKRRSLIGSFPLAIIGLGLVVFNLIVTGAWLRSRGHIRLLIQGVNAKDIGDAVDKIHWTERQIASVKTAITTAARVTGRRYESETKRLQKENKKVKQERDELRLKHEPVGNKSAGSRLKIRETAHLEQLSLMQDSIRKESRRNVLERFGPGPHEVQMTFVHNNVNYDIVIELAPLSTVPHAIHLFLEQVDHGLWNGAYFYGNTMHVLQAGPLLPNADTSQEPFDTESYANLKRFEDLQLETLAFPDYAHEFPHDIWTVGFAGRPGGPDFYINKVDNIQGHGPGGQMQHALEEQGDSCFGRITKGKEHLEDMLFKQPTYSSRDSRQFDLVNPVPIVRAVILTPKPTNEAPIDMVEIPQPGNGNLEPLERSMLDKPRIEDTFKEESQINPELNEDTSGKVQGLPDDGTQNDNQLEILPDEPAI